jgi:hypothetical protein
MAVLGGLCVAELYRLHIDGIGSTGSVLMVLAVLDYNNQHRIGPCCFGRVGLQQSTGTLIDKGCDYIYCDDMYLLLTWPLFLHGGSISDIVHIDCIGRGSIRCGHQCTLAALTILLLNISALLEFFNEA